MIRVLVVDDHAVVRDGLELLLERFGSVTCVGAAADGAEAVSLTDELRPDVVLMDLQMPVMDGIEATRRIVDAHPTVAVAEARNGGAVVKPPRRRPLPQIDHDEVVAEPLHLHKRQAGAGNRRRHPRLGQELRAAGVIRRASAGRQPGRGG